jgi:hypothetical protein
MRVERQRRFFDSLRSAPVAQKDNSWENTRCEVSHPFAQKARERMGHGELWRLKTASRSREASTGRPNYPAAKLGFRFHTHEGPAQRPGLMPQKLA